MSQNMNFSAIPLGLSTFILPDWQKSHKSRQNTLKTITKWLPIAPEGSIMLDLGLIYLFLQNFNVYAVVWHE